MTTKTKPESTAVAVQQNVSLNTGTLLTVAPDIAQRLAENLVPMKSGGTLQARYAAIAKLLEAPYVSASAMAEDPANLCEIIGVTSGQIAEITGKTYTDPETGEVSPVMIDQYLFFVKLQSDVAYTMKNGTPRHHEKGEHVIIAQTKSRTRDLLVEELRAGGLMDDETLPNMNLYLRPSSKPGHNPAVAWRQVTHAS